MSAPRDAAPGAAALRPPARPLPRRALGALAVLWRFSRPHTIVGTTLSILGIYLIATRTLPGVALGDGIGALALTLLAGWCVNVSIVGLNQVEDVEIDRINKPSLPIAAGDLSLPAARRIVAVVTVTPLVLALTQGAVEVAAVGAGLAIGAAYSAPPLRLKRSPVAASLSITVVRALIVNLGVYLHLASVMGGQPALAPVPDAIWALTLFVAPFAFAIAVLKDVPDAEGDRRYRIATFTVRLGARHAMRMGLGALTAAYLGMAIAGPLLVDSANPYVLAVTHLAALALLWRWARGVALDDREGFTTFYMRVWALFFLEYAIVPAAVLAA